MDIGDDMKLVASIGYYVCDTKSSGSFFGEKDDFFGNSYGLARNLAAKFTYFINDVGLKSGDPYDFNRLQLDLSFKYK